MNSNITINIVEPGTPPSPAPIDPVVPNTGLFTSGIGGPEATAIGTVLILTIAAIVVAVCYRKQKKSGKVTKLVHIVDSTKAVLKSKKRITAGLSAIALLASAGTLTTLLTNAGKSNTNAVEGDGLTLDVSSEDLTIEVGDTPVFAVLPVELTVKEATEAGYALTAYADSTDLVSTTNPDNIIPMVTLPDSSVETLESSEVAGELSSLTDNTYGLALDEEPTTKDAEVYMPLSIDSDTPTVLKATDYEETEANDTTTIYYGFYITPDVPYGTYTGTNINYNVEPHYITNLSFNGNGNDGGEDMESIIVPAGDTITLPENTYTKEGYNFIGWNTVAAPTELAPGEPYVDKADYQARAKSADVTLYAQWEQVFYMQKVSEWGSGLQIGDEIVATDNRDGKEYYVARLKDGNIWMTQNLDHNIVSIENFYTSDNTDLPMGTTWTGIATNTADVTFWYMSNTVPRSYDPGNLYWNGGLNTSYDGTLDNMTTESGDAHYHIGNYYNWTAAVAMSNSSSYKKDQKDAGQSICPTGWRLPTYSGNKSYQNLIQKQGFTSGISGNIQNSPVYFTYGGAWNGSPHNIGSYGHYWSSVVKSSDSVYLLHFNVDNHVYPQFSDGRSSGFSVRCVAR